MSNDVCGYIELPLSYEVNALLEGYISEQTVGISSITKDELYNFPKELLPSVDSYIFLIGDSVGYPNASYLIDYLNYAPEADIGFPTDGKERLDILLDVLSDMFRITYSKRMVIALTECNQIEKIKKINFTEMRDIIHADFEEYQAPPDTLYEIIA